VLSSGAGREFYLGRPVDNVHMLDHMLRDLDVKQRKEKLWDAVGETPRRLVAEEWLRRRSGKGVVEVVQVAPQPKGSDKVETRSVAKAGTGLQQGGKQGRKQQQQQQKKKNGPNHGGAGKRKGNWSQKAGPGDSGPPAEKKKR
jgi:hypothetical protein